ncbi:hypothetical protein BT69DRAFT_1295547 [Atractiella rhizophila]|nr:hypothetical protein BT69DRAFT_1295547 [Atractiella rhizophila]
MGDGRRSGERAPIRRERKWAIGDAIRRTGADLHADSSHLNDNIASTPPLHPPADFTPRPQPPPPTNIQMDLTRQEALELHFLTKTPDAAVYAPYHRDDLFVTGPSGERWYKAALARYYFNAEYLVLSHDRVKRVMGKVRGLERSSDDMEENGDYYELLPDDRFNCTFKWGDLFACLINNDKQVSLAVVELTDVQDGGVWKSECLRSCLGADGSGLTLRSRVICLKDQLSEDEETEEVMKMWRCVWEGYVQIGSTKTDSIEVNSAVVVPLVSDRVEVRSICADGLLQESWEWELKDQDLQAALETLSSRVKDRLTLLVSKKLGGGFPYMVADGKLAFLSNGITKMFEASEVTPEGMREEVEMVLDYEAEQWRLYVGRKRRAKRRSKD